MSASSRRRSGAKGGGAWKKSPALAAILIAAIVVVWALMFWPGGGGTDQYVIKNMDFVFIAQNAPSDFKIGEEPKLITLQYDNNKVPGAPFQKDGQWLWEAYECTNPDCPFVKKFNKKFVFPYFNEKLLERAKNPPPAGPDGMPPPEEMQEPASCVLCKQANTDAYRVERFQTEKAKAEQKAMTEKIIKENP